MTAAKKSTPPPLSLPERPPSKVEQGLAGAKDERAAELDAAITESTASAEQLRERAIEAMVAAGLTREFAEASFILADEGEASAADVAGAVEEVRQLDFGQPLCSHGCHGPSWDDVPAGRDGVGCEHGSFFRHPQGK